MALMLVVMARAIAANQTPIKFALPCVRGFRERGFGALSYSYASRRFGDGTNIQTLGDRSTETP